MQSHRANILKISSNSTQANKTNKRTINNYNDNNNNTNNNNNNDTSNHYNQRSNIARMRATCPTSNRRHSANVPTQMPLMVRHIVETRALESCWRDLTMPTALEQLRR